MTKRTCILFLAFSTSFVMHSCSGGKKPKGNLIKGRLDNAPEAMVYLESIGEGGETFLDSAKTDKEGNFVLANAAAKLDYYMFRVDATNAVFLVLQGNENIEINGNAKDLENTYTVSGSKDCELIHDLKRYDKYISDSLFTIFKSQSAAFPENRDSLIKASQQIYADRMKDYAKQFIDLNPASIVALSVTRYLDHNSKEELLIMENLSKSLSEKYQDNVYVRKYAEGLEDLKFLPAGSQAPEISLPDSSGKIKKLSSLHGKVVLIDFWASWCVPCRQENPRVVALYNKYKSKGFEIFSVSLDDNKENWTQAIRADKLSWTHVSELKKWDGGVVKDYRVSAIPFTVLLDRNGNIIEKGLSGEELEQKLKEVL